jgi:hypothetical protein
MKEFDNPHTVPEGQLQPANDRASGLPHFLRSAESTVEGFELINGPYEIEILAGERQILREHPNPGGKKVRRPQIHCMTAHNDRSPEVINWQEYIREIGDFGQLPFVTHFE